MPGQFEFYVCPFCKGKLEIHAMTLRCPACDKAYPVEDGIPDFLAGETDFTSRPVDNTIRLFNQFAGVYEGGLWYSIVINFFAGWNATTFSKLVGLVRNAITVDKGAILDVACGPSTYGRRIATPARAVFGIDLSMPMLRQGIEYVRRDGVENVNLSCIKVETLPFADVSFDAAICCGSLHLFPDPLLALKEISRTLKPGATLAVLTFIAGKRGLFRYEFFRRHAREEHGMYAFKAPELEEITAQAGFDEFKPQIFGSAIFFTVRKRK